MNVSAVAGLSFAEALQSPCGECRGLCCCYLPLQTLPVRNLMEADYIRYLLAFPRLQAGFSANGQWSVYYTMPCRHFDTGTHRCRVHGTWEQPRTCVAYNEHDCWYQRAIAPDSAGFLLFDRRRLERLLTLMVFGKDRNITSVPSWQEMVALCAELPLLQSWDELEASNAADPPAPIETGEAGRREMALPQLMEDPCEGCAAPCCRYLYFPLPVPSAYMQLDYIRFCLNFSGVECAVTPAAWWLLVRTDCAFFQNEERRCALYGMPERPLHCAHLNQWSCAEYRQLLDPEPEAVRRLGREAFAQLVAEMRFDEQGRITYAPTLF